MVTRTKDDALVLVTRTVTNCLSAELGNNPPPNLIDTGKTFTGSSAATSYRLTPARYGHVCYDVANDLRISSGRDFYYTTDFIDDHEDKKISKFIFDTATILLAAPELPHVATAVAWVSSLPPEDKL